MRPTIKSAHLSGPCRSIKAGVEIYINGTAARLGVTVNMPSLELLDFSDVRQVYGLVALAGAAVFYLNFIQSDVSGWLVPPSHVQGRLT